MHHISEPRILSSKKVYKVEVGGEVKLECNVKNLGSMVLLWKQVHKSELTDENEDSMFLIS